MPRLRLYQLSLRRLFLLTAVFAAGLWIALWWLGRITPQRGETLVTAEEKAVLESLKSDFLLNYTDRMPFT